MKSNNNNMASLLGAFFYTFLIAIANASSEFKVGDSVGWREPDANNTQIYNQWAAHNRFLVGDSLNFEYNKEDSVLVVDKFGYYHCNTTKPISAFNDGKTVIKLDNPGPFYFISGTPDHCNNGQRMVVNVLGLHPIPQSPPPSSSSIANPPQTYMNTDSPSPSPNQNSGISITSTVSLIPFVLTLVITSVMSMA
ncbi:stellacyanin-like [Telopea speciosissima]|uniref:stellacyanin-like n=1 Tax=Telopea speciosissima TaxID=54955 RepID=UPI001CC6C6C7|nr:stellacyanin-like [Telopea speciosissima]